MRIIRFKKNGKISYGAQNDDGSVFVINGNKLIDSKFFYTTKNEDRELKFVLGRDEYFVLGDNYIHSNDSRHYGPVNKKQIIGKVL